MLLAASPITAGLRDAPAEARRPKKVTMTETPKNPQQPPTGLGPGGRALWRAIAKDHTLDGMQRVQLTEACRAKDRCDRLDKILSGDVDTWARLVHDTRTEDYELRIDAALTQANTTANTMKQLLAALRLPDLQTGTRPQQRGPRGAQKPTVPGGADKPGKISSMERARERAAARKTS